MHLKIHGNLVGKIQLSLREPTAGCKVCFTSLQLFQLGVPNFTKGKVENILIIVVALKV